tara:strand:- start:1023 stop:1385 length:363 start_codon:yes stop_codon:yes gene_type:complete
MSWEDILKVDENATNTLRETILRYKRNSIPYDIQMMVMTMKQINPNVTLEQMKNSLRTAWEKTYLDPKMVKVWVTADRGYQKLLKDNNWTFEDVDWDEVLIPVVAEYDKAIDALTEADLE